MKLRRAGKNTNVIFFILILIIIIGVASFLFLSLRVDTFAENLQRDNVIKVLFVMEDKNQVLFTDIFIYYPVSGRGALINILGNTGSIFQSLGRVDRIDAIFTEMGIEVYKNEIEKLVGQTIPFYIEMNLDRFGELTDMLGGIRVFVPSPVDVKNEDEDRWLLPSGAVTLDGDKIKTYLKYSVPDENESEIDERRQNVMVSFLGALNRNLSHLSNKRNFFVYSKKFTSNAEKDDLFRLVNEISHVDSERLVPQNITGSKRIVDGKSLLFPYYDGQLIKDVVKQATTSLISLDDTNISRIYVLEIQNGTTVQGLARNTAALLQSAGYDVLSTINADRNDYENTVIISHLGSSEVAKTLADFIHCERILDEEVQFDADDADLSTNVDFTIILGKDFDGRYVKNIGGR